MEFLFIFLFILVLFLIFEIRIKKPDQLALFEKKGNIFLRKGKFYPRHLTLILSSSVYSYSLDIYSEAKGKLKIKTTLTLSVAPDKKDLSTLIQTGGWNENTVLNASKEINNQLNSFVQTLTEKQDIEDISPEKLINSLKENLVNNSNKLGLQVVSIGIQNIEPENIAIADAIRNRETARVLEETEAVKQNSRISSFKSKTEADDKIAKYEHQLEIMKLELKKIEDEKESILNHERVKEELKNKKLRLELEKEELSLLASHPELLVLSPQVARLADASRNLKNAKTVVSLSGKELADENPLGNLLQETIGKLTNNLKSSKNQ